MGMIDIESFTGNHVYIDANLFIYAVEGFKKHASLCDHIFRSIEDMKIHAVTSELTLSEVLVHPIKNGDQRAIASYEALVKSRYDLEVVPVTRDVLRKSAALRASVGLKLPDAIHVATAQVYGSQFIFTADAALKTPDTIKLVTLDELLKA